MGVHPGTLEASTEASAATGRIASIDALRGLVMVLMLLDHLRETWFLHVPVADPVDARTALPALFLARLAVSLCAPVFVVLTGVAAYLFGTRHTLAETRAYLVKRGLVLMAFEVFYLSELYWGVASPTLWLQVIWCIGVCMIVLAALIGLGAAAQLVLTAAILRGGLRPLARLSDVVRRLSRGELATRAGPVSTPDLAPLAADLDRLGAALAAAHADRARLSRQVVGRGDQERQAIARDLHDEYGPCLFALRVEAQAIRDRSPDPAACDHAGNILAIADEIRRVNTALLSGLRPMAVGQLPLATVLSDMIDDLSRRHPAIRWTLTLPPDLPEPDEATALTLYRILQEGTTNALRHSGATAVTASVSRDAAGWSVTLSDDGRGLGGAPEGNGLSGMRERVALLGGSFGMRDSARGVTLHATLPPES